MSSISELLVKEKLGSWTSSNKVQEVLGLSSMDERSFKKELTALETRGIIERMGAKKGLKFKCAGSVSKPVEITEKVKKPKEEKPEKANKNSSKKIEISDISCEITTLDKHEFTNEVTNVSISQLMAFIAKNPGDHSFSVAIKRTQRGIQVKTYRDIYLLSDVLYTKESFMNLLKASGVSLE